MKPVMLFTSAIAALVLLAGCGDDTPADTTSDGSTTTTIEQPSGATQTKSGTETKSSEPKAAAARTREQAELQKGLLQLSDFPAGWQAMPPEMSGMAPDLSFDDAAMAPTGCKSLDDLAAGGQNLDLNPPVSVTSSFIGGIAGPFAVQQVGNWDNDDDPKKVIEAFEQALGGCDSLTSTDAGTIMTLKVTKPKVDKRGDQTVALGLSGGDAQFPFTAALVTQRRGEVTSHFTWITVGTTIDDAALNDFAKKIDDRLKAID